MGIGAAIGGVATLASGLFGANAASQASQAQVQMQQQALALQQQMFNKTQQNLSPYMAYGQGNMAQLQASLPSLTAAFNPTEAQLASTPGYQFTLNQGIQGLDNNYSAQGLGGTSSVWGTPGANGTATSSGPQGPSGALGKALAGYTTGLADQTFNQQFQNYWGQNNNIYNMLNTGVNTGLSAAGGANSAALSSGQNMSNTLTNMGTATASGILGSTAAMNTGIQGLAGGAQQALMYGAMQGGQPNSLSSLFGSFSTPMMDNYTSPLSGLTMASNGMVGGNGGV